jgi:hypothetical protein
VRKSEALRLQPGEQVTFGHGRPSELLRTAETGVVEYVVRGRSIRVMTADGRKQWVPRHHVIDLRGAKANE